MPSPSRACSTPALSVVARYARWPALPWSACACVIAARATGAHGTRGKSPGGQSSPSGGRKTRSSGWGGVAAAGCGLGSITKASVSHDRGFDAQPGDPMPMTRTATGLQYEDTVVGGGPTARAGQPVMVHYTGWLHDAGAPQQRGAKFDSSKDRNDPFRF